MNGNVVQLATRRSALALAQARLARAHLERAMPACSFGFLEMTTTGDQRSGWSLAAKGGKGLFTKELEEALLDGRAFVAVHSAKDLPTTLPDGLVLAGYLPRADPRDVLVRRDDSAGLQHIASSSPRRRAQGSKLWPRARWSEIRGNVETRLRKIQEGFADATILAAAGLSRLGISAWPGLRLEPIGIDSMVPAAGQAAIGIECRTEDVALLAPLLHQPTRLAVTIERGFLHAFGGGCQSAAAAHWSAGTLHVFHEALGNATFPLPALSEEQGLAALPAIIDRIHQAE